MDEITIKLLRDLADEYGARKLILFGSAVLSFEKSRDIDLACEGITGKNFLRFGAKLEEIFNKSVDLIQIEERSRLIDEILKKGVIIYEA
ncbi:nucleotidyltransferase family protein [Bacteroidota bacterium]